jgi:hypothetical protein
MIVVNKKLSASGDNLFLWLHTDYREQRAAEREPQRKVSGERIYLEDSRCGEEDSKI